MVVRTLIAVLNVLEIVSVEKIDIYILTEIYIQIYIIYISNKKNIYTYIT